MREALNVVMLHDSVSGDFHSVRTSMGLEAPLHIQSFTDTLTKENPYNVNLQSAAQGADVLLIQDHLALFPTQAAYAAINSALLSSASNTKFWLFDGEYGVSEFGNDDLTRFTEVIL